MVQFHFHQVYVSHLTEETGQHLENTYSNSKRLPHKQLKWTEAAIWIWIYSNIAEKY